MSNKAKKRISDKIKENQINPQSHHGIIQRMNSNIGGFTSMSDVHPNPCNEKDMDSRPTPVSADDESTKVLNMPNEMHTNQTSSSNKGQSNINQTLKSSSMPPLMKRHLGVKYTGATQWTSEHHTLGRLGQSKTLKKKPSKRGGTYFVLAVIFFIGFEYLSYTCVILSSFFSTGLFGIIYTVIFNILFFLMLLSFFKTSLTDPGVVPANWGFYMGEEGKRRRYCKVCHVWKPDRTHHCSACGRCVLNMDHHCPWVNNCIGFGNRKFFIQLLCYALLCVSSVMIHTTHFLLVNGSQLVPKDFSLSEDSILHYLKDVSIFSCSVIMLLFAVLLGIPLIPFTKFHLTMISKNSSTIENMDVLNRTRGLYDLGISRNLQQVLGPHWFLWWVPLHLSCSKPVGDGVRWRQHYWKAVQPG